MRLALALHPRQLLSLEFRHVDAAQSNVEEYIGKHGATVPSVRTFTIFCPARQFQSSSPARCGADDWERVVAEAIAGGAIHIVVGRPIMEAENPAAEA